MRSNDRVVVVGGGLAGVAAAADLAAAGRPVVLLESRPRLGGRAYSFNRGGLCVDSGQHVILRCYTEYRGLLARMGVAGLVPLQDRLDIPVLRTDGRATRIRRGRHGPAPLHLLLALLGYRALPLPDRLGVARAASALRGVDPDDPGNDLLSFGGWLRRYGQGERSMRLLWGLLTVPALNIDPDAASLALAARVFRTGVLDEVAAGDIGVPTVPLSQLHDSPARALLAGLGAEVRGSTRVTAIRVRPAGFAVETQARTGGPAQTLAATQVVLAVQHETAARLVPQGAVEGAGRWPELGRSAIVNTHVLFDRAVTDLSFAAAPDSPVQWLFDRSRASGLPAGRHLVTSLSAADQAAREPAATLVRDQLAALRALLPAARRAEVLDAFVTREPRATFRQQPGTARLRPATRTRLPGLVLAGAWTATGWPDTLEGAVRSGRAAAGALLRGSAVSEQRERVPA